MTDPVVWAPVAGLPSMIVPKTRFGWRRWTQDGPSDPDAAEPWAVTYREVPRSTAESAKPRRSRHKLEGKNERGAEAAV
jgi:hypothetical protein